MNLPIFDIQEELVRSLEGTRPRVLLRAPTGSGKSTGVPPIMADAGWTEKGMIVIVQPRRMAARLLAERVAALRHSPLGEEVGYAVRFDRKSGKKTRILYITDGILERWLLDNPLLSGVAAVLFDEFHERRLAGDLCLARVLSLQENERPDLAVIVMSATLHIQRLEDYLAPCRVLEAEGKMYPVECLYAAPKPVSDGRGHILPPTLWDSAAAAVREAASKPDHGDILVFLPGSYEIRRTQEILENDSRLRGFDIHALYGTLSPEKQHAAVSPGSRPKIIVSTNVAETSLTIEGLRTVIDTGVARVASRDPRRELDTLTIKKIARAAADQRAGRAGRTAPGRCYRLWSEADHARRPEFEEPEILRVELSPAVLALSCWGVTRPEEFRWLTPPDERSLSAASTLLRTLGAVDKNGTLTPVGKEMSSYPLAPRLARLLVAGSRHGCLPEMAFIAALIQGENVLAKPGEIPEKLRNPDDYTDFQAEARAAFLAEKSRFDPTVCARYGVHARGSREVLRAYDQLLRLSAEGKAPPYSPEPDFADHRREVTLSLIEGYADHIGARNGIAVNTCRLAGGKRGKLPAGSCAYKGMIFVSAEVSEIEGKTLETRISRCTTLEADQLAEACPDDLLEEDRAVYDEGKRRVLRHRVTLFRDLVLLEQEKGDATPEEAAPLLAAKIADGTLRLTQWDDAVSQWILRLNALRGWMPELELPTFTEEDQAVAFSLLCEGAIGYKDIKDRPVLPVLREWLSPWQREALSRYAPTQLSLSNGQNAKVRYDDLGIPRIGLTVQRLYDVDETPRIANGTVPVTVEVLAPNQRPWQVTSNLKTFWTTGYPQMKKDLAARYPRQKWR